MRVDKLQPGKKYKMCSIFGSVGLGIYTVDKAVKMNKNVSKLHEINFKMDNTTEKVMVSQYAVFVEVE